MRIHTVTALYVFAFSFFFQLDRTEYAVLFLTFAAVIMGELFNTSAETISDRVAGYFDPAVGMMKDLASGAVLVGAFFAVCVAVCLFWKPDGFRRIWQYFVSRPPMILVLAAVTAISIAFIEPGPLGMRDRLRKRKAEREERHE
jgi:diacylglycerol kinase